MWPALLHYGLNLKKKIPFRENKNKCSTIFTSASNDANTLTYTNVQLHFFPFVAQCVLQHLLHAMIIIMNTHYIYNMYGTT